MARQLRFHLGGRRSLRLGATVFLLAVGWACGRASDRPAALELDPVRVLAANLTHGLGEHPLDSELAGDSTNAVILLRARGGIASADLPSHIIDRDERLAALVEGGLLLETDSGIRTAFPILIGEDAEEYRRLTTRVAGAVLDALKPRLEQVLTQLQQRGWELSAYHFVWSQVFDSQFAWAEIVGRGLVPPLAPAVAWVVFPPHPFMSGTNYYPDDSLGTHFLMVTWTPPGRETIRRIGGSWRPVYRAVLAGRPEPSDVPVLERLGLLDETGHVSIPVVASSDGLYRSLQRASHDYIEALRGQILMEELMRVTGAGRKVSWAMAYHDVAWDVLRRLTEEGTIAHPPALRAAARSASSGEPEGPADFRGTSAVIEVYPPFLDLVLGTLGGG